METGFWIVYHSHSHFINPEPVQCIETIYLQINMVKYDADWEIMNTYKNLQIVWSQFFTDKLIFIYIWSNLNIYWFIGIWINENEHKRRAVQFHLTICNIWSPIWWVITKAMKIIHCYPTGTIKVEYKKQLLFEEPLYCQKTGLTGIPRTGELMNKNPIIGIFSPSVKIRSGRSRTRSSRSGRLTYTSSSVFMT